MGYRAVLARQMCVHSAGSCPILTHFTDIRSHFVLPSSFTFGRSSTASSDESDDALGKDAWKDRREAEKQVARWLAEYPSTFVTITGPHGSGKASLVTRVLKSQEKPALVLDCSEIAKAKNDAALVSALANQTGGCSGTVQE